MEYRPSDIVMVRHGESVWNAWGREQKKKGNPPPEMQGVPDHRTPLTQRGVEQAGKTGKALGTLFNPAEGNPFAIIYHSPYIRATRTAQLIAEELPYEVRLYRDLLIVEQQFGWLDAGVFPDKKKFRALQEQFRAFKESAGKFYAKPPNGESWYDVTLRTHDFLAKLFCQEWNGKPVLVVSHAVTIATFMYHLAGRDEDETANFYQKHDLDNCGVVHFRHNLDSELHWDLVVWNKCYWND